MTHDEDDGLVFHDNLHCLVQRLEYDFARRAGVLYLADHNCTDMRGCIDLFKAIDPRVKDIVTIAGKRRDTSYRLIGEKWQARAGSVVRE